MTVELHAVVKTDECAAFPCNHAACMRIGMSREGMYDGGLLTLTHGRR